MTPIERQILENQYAIISSLLNYQSKEDILRKQINDTFELLTKEKSEELPCEMSREEIECYDKAKKGLKKLKDTRRSF